MNTQKSQKSQNTFISNIKQSFNNILCHGGISNSDGSVVINDDGSLTINER